MGGVGVRSIASVFERARSRIRAVNRAGLIVAMAVVSAVVPVARAAPVAAGPASGDGNVLRVARPSLALPPAPGTTAPIPRSLVPDRDAYTRGKARAARRAGLVVPAGSPRTRGTGPPPPEVLVSRGGVFDPRGTPSDSTGAIGPTRYIELVNTRFGIYRRDGSQVSGGNISSIAHLGQGYPFLTDPQVIWDPTTERFYLVILDFDVFARFDTNGFDYVFAYSKSSAPNGAGDWCAYTASFGYDDPDRGRRRIPDQPHMGDTIHHLMWGVNAFDADTERFLGAEVNWITKPDGGHTCQSPEAFRTGSEGPLKTATGTRIFTPVAANQTDPGAVGYLMGTRPVGGGGAHKLFVYRATDHRDGTLGVEVKGRGISVPQFRMPPPAPQLGGGGRLLDTLDTRLTQAVSAQDPAKGHLGLWTQHTVEGGAGSAVRWYEIDPVHAEVLQVGTVSDPDLFAFNGAISPDRLRRGNTAKFGTTAVIGFDTSSEDTDVAVQMVSKTAQGEQSEYVKIRQSPGPNKDFSCSPVCRWGDYSGATPDPGAFLGADHGRVWLTNMWNIVGGQNTIDWRTWNWQAKP